MCAPLIRLNRVLLWITTCLALLVPAGARAVTIRLCECTPGDFDPGAELTLGFRIEADPGENVFGVGISAYGYNESVVDFVTGRSVPSIFHEVALPAIGAFDGIGNVLTNPLGESSIGANGNRVLLFNGIGLQARSYNPLDPGLDGVVGGVDAQIRVTLRATGPGATNLYIGTGYPGDGIVGPGGVIYDSNTLVLNFVPGYDPCPVPEPGTALLAGLGMATLAARRPRAPRPAAETAAA